MDINLDGLLPENVVDVAVLRERPGHAVFRIFTPNNSYILKAYTSIEHVLELRIYALLQNWDVPTIPVHLHTNSALVLEDLQSSSVWRLAVEADIDKKATGIALADWYQRLHRAGYEALSDLDLDLSFLKREIDALNAETLVLAGKSFGFDQLPVWKLAIESIGMLTSTYRSLPHTFNYNDFAAENLALSPVDGDPERAVVFDYDCFGIGLAYSDWRNVIYALKGQARDAFANAYGEISRLEKIIDEPLSLLYNLVVASSRQEFPEWAKPSVKSVINGDLEIQIRTALEGD